MEAVALSFFKRLPSRHSSHPHQMNGIPNNVVDAWVTVILLKLGVARVGSEIFFKAAAKDKEGERIRGMEQ